MQRIVLKDKQIPLKVYSSKNCKSVKISFPIKKEYILISKPKYVSLKKVLQLIEQNQEYLYQEYLKVVKKKEKIQKESNMKQKKWITGEKLLLQGKLLTLQVQEENLKNKTMIEIRPNQILNVTIPTGLNSEERKKYIIAGIKAFLKQQTFLLVKKSLCVWCEKIGVDYQQFRIKDVKTRWGSCVKKTQHLNFSLRLAMLPQEVLDAIVVHELCHLKEANHSKQFWKLVYQYYPNYLKAQVWLKENQSLLEIE